MVLGFVCSVHRAARRVGQRWRMVSELCLAILTKVRPDFVSPPYLIGYEPIDGGPRIRAGGWGR